MGQKSVESQYAVVWPCGERKQKMRPLAKRLDTLEGKTIVVTGVSSGIGSDTAKLLRQQGARVIGLDRNDPSLSLDGFVKADLSEQSGVDAVLAVALGAVLLALAVPGPDEQPREHVAEPVGSPVQAHRGQDAARDQPQPGEQHARDRRREHAQRDRDHIALAPLARDRADRGQKGLERPGIDS